MRKCSKLLLQNKYKTPPLKNRIISTCSSLVNTCPK